MSLISLLKQDDNTDQEISDDGSEDPRESNVSSDIKEDDLGHQQEFLRLSQACRNNSLRTARVPLQWKRGRTHTVIACSPFPNSRHGAWAMAPQLLKRQMSTLLNKLSESDRAPSTLALPPRKSTGDQNVPQPESTADQNIPQKQKATFEVAKRFMEANIFTKTPWPILSDDKYSFIKEASKLAIEAEDRQGALAGAPGDMPSVCRLPGGPSLKIDPQTREAVGLGLCLMLLYQISDIDYVPQYTYLKLNSSTIRGQLADGAHQTGVHSYQLDLRSETELRIQVKELLSDDAYLFKVVDDKKSWFTRNEVLDQI